ncbi:MAG: SDR family oxidoreductase [Clostridia bacterium]|nr:SDR family oxidoreductase [Clostridia bacterium]
MKDDKVVLITGCSSGIGRELCGTFMEKGFQVIATARNLEALKDVTAAMKLSLDVTQKESVDAAVLEVLSRFHKIDILVNNAGFSVRGALEEIDIRKIESMFDVNVFGLIRMIQAVAPVMRQQRSGRIINIGSISGRFAQPINSAYCASKFAVEALSDALRLELSPFNIQVTVIEPGPIKTHFFRTLEGNSSAIMTNENSCYSGFYRADSRRRSTQSMADAKEAASTIYEITQKEQLRPRYQVAVPLIHSMLASCPGSLREYLFKKMH